jgi:hypothetical protein
MNTFSNLKNQIKDRFGSKGDQAKALERTFKHYELFKKGSSELNTALDEANLNQTEKNDYMNYFDQMNKAYVKTALGKFTDPSFNSAYLNNMTNYVKSDSDPVDETKIDPAKYYEIHSAVVSKYGNKDLKETLSIFRAEVRKKNPNTTEFDEIDKKYPIMVDNKVVAVKNIPLQVVKDISNNSPLNQKEKDNILAIANVHNSKNEIIRETNKKGSEGVSSAKYVVPQKDILAIAAVHKYINKII